MLDDFGLHSLIWNLADQVVSDILVASPMDAGGRGIALSVRETKFLTGNEWSWRLLRTIAQGVLGVVVANVDMIVGYEAFDPATRALVAAFVMAALSPVVAELGAHLDEADVDVPKGGGDAA